MFPISAAFRAALADNHDTVVLAELLLNGVLVRTLEVTSGSVTVDTQNAIRRRFSATLTDPDGSLTPKSASDLLSPITTEVRLARGIRFTNGTTEMIPLGVFDISDVEIEDSGDGIEIALSGFDRARKVQRARFIDPYTIMSGTNYSTAIRDLIEFVAPGNTFNFIATTATTPTLTFNSGDDPWAAASGMAASLGAELFFDPAGVCVLRRIVRDEDATPVWIYQEGEDATLLGVSRKISDSQTYNVVVASTAENTDDAIAPVRAVVRDENANSATFYAGPYGTVTRFFSSPFLRTEQQAFDAAKAILERALGIVEDVQFTAIVNPAHDTGDVIQIIRPAAGINSRYTIESLTIPLAPDESMSATTKKRDTGDDS